MGHFNPGIRKVIRQRRMQYPAPHERAVQSKRRGVKKAGSYGGRRGGYPAVIIPKYNSLLLLGKVKFFMRKPIRTVRQRSVRHIGKFFMGNKISYG
jgi:hypothetical protein